MANLEIHIFPVDDGARIEASYLKRVWVKDYPSMPAATKEGEELGLKHCEKVLLDRSQTMPNYPRDLKARIDTEVTELVKRGFQCSFGNREPA
ncbi:MAG: hypothetical protein ABSC77_04430 [Terracidiphilus sp.]|jgi:hypothetical protein